MENTEILNLSREFVHFGDMLLIMHTMWKTMTLFQTKSTIRAILY